MKLIFLLEAFKPWEFHKHLIAQPNASDVLSMLRLLKKHFDIDKTKAWLSDMIPEWNVKVFPYLSNKEVEEINKEVRRLGVPELFLIQHGFSDKAGKDFKFYSPIYFEQAVDWILNGDWIPSFKQLTDIHVNNQNYLWNELDRDKAEEWYSFVIEKVSEAKKQPTMQDMTKRMMIDPNDNPDELGI